MRWWKVAGLAAFVGVAATGVVVARAERRRRAYTPDEVRARLHGRLAEAAGGVAAGGGAAGDVAAGGGAGSGQPAGVQKAPARRRLRGRPSGS